MLSGRRGSAPSSPTASGRERGRERGASTAAGSRRRAPRCAGWSRRLRCRRRPLCTGSSALGGFNPPHPPPSLARSLPPSFAHVTAGARPAARALAPLPLLVSPRLCGRAPRPPPDHGPRAPPPWHAPAPGTRGHSHPAPACEPPLPLTQAGSHPPPAGTLARTGTRGPLAFTLSRERPPDGCSPRASRAAGTAGLRNARAPTPTPTPPDSPGPLGAHPIPQGRSFTLPRLLSLGQVSAAHTPARSSP